MSIKIMSAVFESLTLGPTDRLVLLALADHAGEDGTCYPSIARLCQRTGLGERAVQVSIKRLKEAGQLTAKMGGGRGNSTLYTITINPAAETPFKKPRITNPVSSDINPAFNALNPAPDAPEPLRTIIEPSEEDLADKPPLKRRACQLPDGWVPSDKNIRDAEAKGFSAAEIESEADRFRDFHTAKGSTFKCWDAAWRTWLGNARRFASRGMAGKASPGGHGQGSSIASIAARRWASGQV